MYWYFSCSRVLVYVFLLICFQPHLVDWKLYTHEIKNDKEIWIEIEKYYMSSAKERHLFVVVPLVSCNVSYAVRVILSIFTYTYSVTHD